MDSSNNQQLGYTRAYAKTGFHVFPCFYVLKNGSCSCGKNKCTHYCPVNDSRAGGN